MNRDLNIGLCLSLGAHSLVLFGFSPIFQGPQIGLPIGDGSIEVNLVAAGPGRDGVVAPKSKSRPARVSGVVAPPPTNPEPKKVDPALQEDAGRPVDDVKKFAKPEETKIIEEPLVQGMGGEMSPMTQLADAGNSQVRAASSGDVGHSDSVEGGGGKDRETISAGGSDGVASPLYASNPKPEYPLSAQRLLQQGRVILKVVVSEWGHVLDLGVDKSSGYRMLDQAAERAVRAWKFIPARRGEMAVTSTCVVPITFDMRNGVEVE